MKKKNAQTAKLSKPSVENRLKEIELQISSIRENNMDMLHLGRTCSC